MLAQQALRFIGSRFRPKAVSSNHCHWHCLQCFVGMFWTIPKLKDRKWSKGDCWEKEKKKKSPQHISLAHLALSKREISNYFKIWCLSVCIYLLKRKNQCIFSRRINLCSCQSQCNFYFWLQWKQFWPFIIKVNRWKVFFIFPPSHTSIRTP